MCIGKNISDEVKRIMGPSTPNISYNSIVVAPFQMRNKDTVPASQEDQEERENTK